jgi:hypothetical protein
MTAGLGLADPANVRGRRTSRAVNHSTVLRQSAVGTWGTKGGAIMA